MLLVIIGSGVDDMNFWAGVFIVLPFSVIICPLTQIGNIGDCILVSNLQSIVALPFYVIETGFRGTVYATEPIVQFGRCEFVDLKLLQFL